MGIQIDKSLIERFSDEIEQVRILTEENTFRFGDHKAYWGLLNYIEL